MLVSFSLNDLEASSSDWEVIVDDPLAVGLRTRSRSVPNKYGPKALSPDLFPSYVEHGSGS
jgi:hypothetical protein